MVNFDQVATNRKTYDLLAFLADVGGLFQALTWFCSFFIIWFADFNAGVFLMINLFVNSTKKF